ncbi:MAG TPA: hypothetical protein VLM37_03425 [Fibrobacteraceae bacterium]|nr:hypothetical protein [Fibrobacteraceae bacterium]
MGKPNTTLGIEIGDSSLKLALFDHKQSKVLRMGVIETTSHPLREVDVLEKSIAQWTESLEDPVACGINLTIPARLCVVRLVEIPQEIKDVRDYVEWEFSTAVNAQRSEYYLDYQLAEAGRKPPKIAVVGAIRRIWMDTMRRGFQRRELVPQVVEVDAFSLLNLMEKGIAGHKGGVVCVVKVDRTGVILVWGQAGTLCGLRWVSVSALSTMSRMEAFQALAKDLTDELHKGFANVGIDNAEGQIVHLCGDLSIEPDFVEALRKSSPAFLYHLLDAFHKIQIDAESATSNRTPLCAAAIGAALRYREDRK